MAGDVSIMAVKVWDVGHTGDAEWTNLPGDPTWVSSMAFDASGRRLIATREDGSVAVWDPETGANVRTVRAHRSPADPDVIFALDLSPAGRLIATAGSDQAVRVSEAATGNEVFLLRLGRVEDVDWSPDGRLLAIALVDQGAAKIVDRSGEEVTTLEERPGFGVVEVEFGPGGQLLATANWSTGRPDPTAERVKIWDWKRATVRTEIAVSATGLAFHPSGERIAIALGGLAETWEVRSGRKVATFTGHEGVVWDVAFSPDGSRLATSSVDTTVRLWDARSGVQRLVLPGHQLLVGSWPSARTVRSLPQRRTTQQSACGL
jgi:WD40 repeat protein